MRELRYSVASSLDGFIAGPQGEFDWIVVDPEIDFAAMYAGFSGLVMGRRSYEVFVATGGTVGPALPTYVCSRTLPEGERDGVVFVRDAVSLVRRLKSDGESETGDGESERESGSGSGSEDDSKHRSRVESDSELRPLWLWGGSELFADLAGAGLVDGVEVAIIPVVLGAGIPLMAPSGPRLRLRLRSHRLYAGTGTLMLSYDVLKV